MTGQVYSGQRQKIVQKNRVQYLTGCKAARENRSSADSPYPTGSDWDVAWQTGLEDCGAALETKRLTGTGGRLHHGYIVD